MICRVPCGIMPHSRRVHPDLHLRWWLLWQVWRMAWSISESRSTVPEFLIRSPHRRDAGSTVDTAAWMWSEELRTPVMTSFMRSDTGWEVRRDSMTARKVCSVLLTMRISSDCQNFPVLRLWSQNRNCPISMLSVQQSVRVPTIWRPSGWHAMWRLWQTAEPATS